MCKTCDTWLGCLDACRQEGAEKRHKDLPRHVHFNEDLPITFRSKVLFFTAEKSHYLSTPDTSTRCCVDHSADPAKHKTKPSVFKTRSLQGEWH